jgi:hypothetical protein
VRPEARHASTRERHDASVSFVASFIHPSVPDSTVTRKDAGSCSGY